MFGRIVWPKRSTGSVYDPTTANETGFWRGSFSASPWVGTASTGSSGSRDLTEATNPPTAGTAVNGFTPADFNGTTQQLSSGATRTQLLGTTAWSAFALVYPRAFTLSLGSRRTIWTETGQYIELSIDTDGTAVLLQYNDLGSIAFTAQTANALNINAWNRVDAQWTGANIRVRVNGGTWASAALATIGGGGTFKVGTRYSGTAGFVDGKILELLFRGDTSSSDTDFDNIKSYVNARYALSL